MEELIKDKPKYITNFNRPDLIKFCTDDNPIEQERLKNIKNTFEELNIKHSDLEKIIDTIISVFDNYSYILKTLFIILIKEVILVQNGH